MRQKVEMACVNAPLVKLFETLTLVVAKLNVQGNLTIINDSQR